MKHISVKMTDADYQKVERRRGDKTKSEYVRMLLASDDECAKKDASDFQQLFKDVTFIKESLKLSFKELPTKKNILALVDYLTEVSSVANPPAYSHHQKELKGLLNTIASKMESGE
jgi:hypothetical protein